METRFTPGPWVVDGSYISQEDEELTGICEIMSMDVGGDKGWFDGPVTEANAHIIAASPDLFAALAAMREYLSKCAPHAGDKSGAEWGLVMDQSHAAMLKATGGQS